MIAALSADSAHSGRPWVDPSFPHSPASLFIDPGQPHQPSWLEAEWVRVGSVVPSSALFAPPMTADDIRQGRLGNCWFLSALAVLTLRQSLVFACFVSPTEQPSGVYAVRFFRDGQQRVVVVDDFIPAMEVDSGAQPPAQQATQWQPLFAQQREGGHSIWSLIIEKGTASISTLQSDDSSHDSHYRDYDRRWSSTNALRLLVNSRQLTRAPSNSLSAHGGAVLRCCCVLDVFSLCQAERQLSSDRRRLG